MHMVESALESLLAEHVVVQVKTTDKGAPNRDDVHCGPYASADREDAEAPASKGAPDVGLLRSEAHDCETFGDVFAFASERGSLAEGAADLVRLPADESAPVPVPEIRVDDEMLAMPEGDQEYEIGGGDIDDMPTELQFGMLDDDRGDFVPSTDTDFSII